MRFPLQLTSALPNLLSFAHHRAFVFLYDNRLLNSEGSLLASAGEDHDIASAIFANIWASFSKCDNSLDFLMAEQEVRIWAMLFLTI